MLKALRSLYAQAGHFARACPWLFLVPIAAEVAQHIAEYMQGFYASIAAARAAEHSALRMGFGTVKVLALYLTGYWMLRWLEWRDGPRVRGFDAASLRTMAPVWLYQLVLGLPMIWAPVVAPALVRPMLFVSLANALLGPLMADWYRAAAIGARLGPIASIRRIAPLYPWAFAFSLAAILPLMVVHYALGYGAMKLSGGVQLLMLAVDTPVVGYLGAVLSGVPWYISERARQRAAIGGLGGSAT